ncbi:transcriptional regulator PpsR [Sphingomonas sp. AR_OL41]|uniref:transcriptional regulator PpsR n=1 Tax=Sphingomonas sp. AR_OL41 TaxID=3042729 RepID=UPI002480336C|nr:transcriptional regulator PpsR [Sphingomonas sp. AR_OL41]MDH7975330.1 transcriptional regulator PpsR [Sphingomonas sp. AR_OL41]
MNKHHAPSGLHAFTAPDINPGALAADVSAAVLGAVGDVTLVLDLHGKILDTAISERELVTFGLGGWNGGDWVDTVTVESRGKVAEMIDEATVGKPARWRQVTHMTPNGDVPIRYLALRLGDGDRIIAIGRDMRSAATAQQRLLQTQQSLERDYIKLRQAEARYRLLFDMAREAVLIVDAGSRRIVEANPAAYRLLGAREGALTSQPATAMVDAEDREAFLAHLGAAEATDDMTPVTLRLPRGRGDIRLVSRLFRQARVALLLVRIESAAESVAGSGGDSRLAEVVERMPDAFVLADGALNILTANAAFVELAEAPSADRVRGASLGTWLGRPGIDLELIMGQLRDHESVRNVATILRGSTGGQEEVEVSGVSARFGEEVCYGFTIRNVGRRLRSVPDPGLDLPRSVEQLTELVGRMSLKEIVRESTDLIERLCIEAALAYTDDNRASAAEILGVSRQSLYSKLHRHGLGSLVPGEE